MVLPKRTSKTDEIYKAVRVALIAFFSVVLIFRTWTIVSVQRTIKDYNALLEMAYNSWDLQPMKTVATDKELRRLQAVLASLYTRKEKAEVKLLEIEFSSISWGFDSVGAEAKEKWFYKLFTEKDSKPKRTDIYNYQIFYSLVRSGLNWKINEIKILKETRAGL